MIYQNYPLDTDFLANSLKREHDVNIYSTSKIFIAKHKKDSGLVHKVKINLQKSEHLNKFTAVWSEKK